MSWDDEPKPLESISRPQLDPTLVDDDERLGEMVDAVIAADIEARARMADIFVYTEALRASLDADTWITFLTYDELANGRFSELLLAVTRFAFAEGRRHPLEGSS